MAKTNFQTIDEYHGLFPVAIQERMEQIRNIVHTVVPDAGEVISYQIPCFKYLGYLIYYSAYAGHISLSYPYSNELLQAFKDELKNYKVSKSAIQFPHNKELPVKLIKGIVEFRKQENINNPKNKK